jgi:hypothetical protein
MSAATDPFRADAVVQRQPPGRRVPIGERDDVVGSLTYDNSLSVEFDDRVLGHLQLVIGAKLRRNESFYFSWRDDQRVGDGRTTIWVHPTIPLIFKYYGSRMPAVNRDWLIALEQSANSNGGLQIIEEPNSPTGPKGDR